MNRLGLLFGVGFGFVLAGARLTDYEVIHGMLRLRDLQPYGVLGSAVAVAAPSLWFLRRIGWITPLGGPLAISRTGIERRHILGSVVFGAGWAVAGACPGPAIALVGSGRLLGLAVIAGLFLGIMLRDRVAARAVTQPRPQSSRSLAESQPVGL
jgi:uncharacterized membrane protein YedE/YeeE